MAYTLDTSTSEGVLRTLIFDKTTAVSPVQETDYLFSDAELTALLDQSSDDLWAAAADGCRAMAAFYAKDAIHLGLGKKDIDLDQRDRPKFFLGLANLYDKRSSGAGGNVVEYFDSYSLDVTSFGEDYSEYIGDF